jgi:hypothetical protein
LITDASLVLASWFQPRLKLFGLAVGRDEHLTRIHEHRRPALGGEGVPLHPSAEFPVPVLMGPDRKLDPVGTRLIREELAAGRRAFVLLVRKPERWPRLVQLIAPWRVRLLRQETGSVWLRLLLPPQSPAALVPASRDAVDAANGLMLERARGD